MRIIISPAKKMRVDTDSMAWRDLPAFLEEAQKLQALLLQLSFDELKKLWKCSEPLARLNAERLQDMDLQRNLTPAIWAYEGLQYRHMLPEVFTDEEFEYVQHHLRILSGFYGMLRPFDGVVPYRLEMQARLSVDGSRDLYDFWGNALAKTLAEETDCILNLASDEYSRCISKHLPSSMRFITCVFGEEKDGRILEKGTLCKMARGEMVRFLAENRIENPEGAKAFSGLHYRFSEKHSDENTYVFVTSAA